MKARDLMSANPFVVTGEEPVSAAARTMRDRDVGIVPVVEVLERISAPAAPSDR